MCHQQFLDEWILISAELINPAESQVLLNSDYFPYYFSDGRRNHPFEGYVIGLFTSAL
jgi:hypothetical protein